MTDRPQGDHGPGAPEEERPGSGPVIRDKRRIDPETGRVRQSTEGADAVSDQSEAQADTGRATDEQTTDGQVPVEQVADETPLATPETDGVPEAVEPETGDDSHPDTRLAAERLEEMRRMQAEFVNFRNRTQREREGDRGRATGAVVEALLPVLDDVHSAREHGDITEGSPFAAIADKLEQALGRFGVERVGAVGEVFDPTVHEALMHLPAERSPVELPEGTTEMTVVQVVQPGFKVGDQVVRAARVAVADPG
ncbi:molecular chaperone GrpE [Serinicoccus chungangensis]|uniref:Protein GrpE n=1 Tax=Serinicoccus chungangensis TaxID=767452 RepID=A0A0W8I2Y6_9MICO|nr:nucleotide exchange factor GrpE [Serinicoccus chungangensis]KUG51911.1 molecular chaperone GrpE [Serinicoccus chungangensis]